MEIILALGRVHIAVHVYAEPGAHLLGLAELLQQEIAGAVEHIVGLQVAEVDVCVDDIIFTASPASAP